MYTRAWILFEWLCETGKEWAGTRLLFRLDASGNGTSLCFRQAAGALRPIIS